MGSVERPIKLFVDDNRLAPEGWVQACTAQQAKSILSNFPVSHLSLDYDLGMMERDCRKCWYNTSAPWCVPGGERGCPGDCSCPCHTTAAPTGYEILHWIMDTGHWPATKPVVHSASAKAQAMRDFIERHGGYRGPNP